MKRAWMVRLAPLAVAAVLAAGCDSGGTDPEDVLENFDGPELTTAVEGTVFAMSASSDANASLTSFFLSGVLAGLGADPAPMPLAASRLRDIGGHAPLRALAGQDGMAALRYHHEIAATFEIPAEIKGSTFVWNPVDGVWEADPEQTGAPANGVRVTWYEVDQVGEPVMPLNPEGYIDLTEEELAGLDALGILIAATDGGTTTLADYAYAYGDTDTETAWSETFLVTGFFRDGEDQVDIDIDLAFEGSYQTGDESYDSNILFEGPDGVYDWRLHGALDGADGAYVDSLDTFITVDGVTTAVELELAGLSDVEASAEGTGELSHDGVVIANILVDDDDFSFTKPDGGSFTAAQEQELFNVVYALYLYAPFIVLPFFFFYY